MIHLTRHALVRMRQRCGLGRTAASRQAERVWMRGIDNQTATGAVGIYLGRVAATFGADVRLYGYYVYVFADDRLLTVWRLPPPLQRIMERA